MDWDRVRRGWRAGGYPAGEPAWVDAPDLSREHLRPRVDPYILSDEDAQPQRRRQSSAVSHKQLVEMARHLVEGTRAEMQWHDEPVTIRSAQVVRKEGRHGLEVVYRRDGDPLSHRTWTAFVLNPKLIRAGIRPDGRARRLQPPQDWGQAG